MICPLCSGHLPPGLGHVCVARATIPGVDYPQPKRRTICADCRWYRKELDWSRYPGELHLCGHENARNVVTGNPTPCAQRNSGNCPDFQAKEQP